jgi:aspartate-semialdehyde dehydrogenase
MTSLRDSNRIVIAGASSLLGAELKSLLEESRFAASDFTLLDEQIAAGILTEAAGEPTIIQPVEEGSFNRARFVFFTASANFTRTNIAAARASGATVIDLSGALSAEPATISWFPALDTLSEKPFLKDAAAYAVPSAAATAAVALSLTLGPLHLQRLAFTSLQPVSEAGRLGIEELEGQTSQLLSFQSIGKPVFGAQVAFTLLDRYGPESTHKLAATRERVRAEARALLTGKSVIPVIQVLHAPVFYGTTFSASVEMASSTDRQAILNACKRGGFALIPDDGPSNISAAGESLIQLATPEPDPAHPETWWFWGAADNIRLPASNAVNLADKLAS